MTIRSSRLVSLMTVTGGLAFSAGALAATAPVYAPFVDMTAWPTPILDQIGVRNGISQFTLGFVTSEGSCVPSWGGVTALGSTDATGLLTSISGSITALRFQGGDVSVSFGGASGTGLLQSCTSVSSLETAYQTVINTYKLTHIDFDIEGAAIADHASVDRNFAAVADLQKITSGLGGTLHVTVTLPVLQSGLTSDGTYAVSSALSHGVSFDQVNVMAMDYGGAVSDMGAAAIQAVSATQTQLAALLTAAGRSSQAKLAWQMVGVTPMIGINDASGETFSLANAATLNSFVTAHGVGLVGIWSIGRDLPCGTAQTAASPSCSGVAQANYAFSSQFGALGGHWGTGVVKNASYGTSSGTGTGTSASGSAWSATAVYTAGGVVTYQGVTYTAQWWTQGDTPGVAAVWVAKTGSIPAVSAWSSQAVYVAGSSVTYAGSTYTAQWWTQGDVPGSAAVWLKT